MVAGAPRSPVPVPDAFADVARGRPTCAVRVDELGGPTFEVGTGPDRCFVRWVVAARAGELEAEVVRRLWDLGH